MWRWWRYASCGGDDAGSTSLLLGTGDRVRDRDCELAWPEAKLTRRDMAASDPWWALAWSRDLQQGLGVWLSWGSSKELLERSSRDSFGGLRVRMQGVRYECVHGAEKEGWHVCCCALNGPWCWEAQFLQPTSLMLLNLQSVQGPLFKDKPCVHD